MTARKKSARKKAAKKAGLRSDLRNLAARFEREIEKAGVRYRAEAARLLRQCATELGRLERRGESTLHQLDATARKRTLSLLADLQKTVQSAKLDTAKGEMRARRAVESAKGAMRKVAARVAP
jgi:predicted chitinase